LQAALYSAILTAFIIESMKLIQEDVTEATRDVLFTITRQLANNTVAAFEPKSFVAPAWAVRVNYYFFTAISCTLMSALSAVLALQWVGSYDTGLNPSSPEGRALQRHVRYRGVEKWRMVQIIAFLPLLIFAALFLFFVGLAEWMWTIHQGVSAIIIAGVILGATFFVATTATSMTYVGAPFRTPTSRSLPSLAVGIYHSTYMLLSGLTFQGLVSALRCSGTHTMGALSSFAHYWKRQSKLSKLLSIRRFLPSPHQPKPFEELEKDMVHSVTDIKDTALIWLANSIDVLPHNFAHFQSILRELLALPPEQLINLSRWPAPWTSIFTLLFDPHLIPPSDMVPRDGESSYWEGMSDETGSDDNGLSDQAFSDREVALQASMLLGKESVSLTDVMEIRYRRNNRRETVISTLRSSVERWECDKSNSLYIVEMMSAAINSIDVLPTNFIAAHLLNVYNSNTRLGNFDLDRAYVYRRPNRFHRVTRRLSKSISLDHMNEKPPSPFPDPIIDILLDIMARRFSQASPSGDTPLERYTRATELFLQQGNDDSNIHNAILTQALGGILRRLEGGEQPEVVGMLSIIARLLRANPTPRSNVAVTAGVLRVLRHVYFLSWEGDDTLKRLITSIYALVLPSPYLFVGEDWNECRVRFYTGLDTLSHAEEWSSTRKQELIWAQVRDERIYGLQIATLSNSQMRRLLEIRSPILWLHASILAGSKWVYPSRVPKPLLTHNEIVRNCKEVWQGRKQKQSHWSYSELSFIRSLILSDDDNRLLWARVSAIETVDGNPMVGDFKTC
jgi:Family of unknown function (DUF6535)